MKTIGEHVPLFVHNMSLAPRFQRRRTYHGTSSRFPSAPLLDDSIYSRYNFILFFSRTFIDDLTEGAARLSASLYHPNEYHVDLL